MRREKRIRRKERTVSAARRLREHKTGGDRLAYKPTIPQFNPKAKSENEGVTKLVDFLVWKAKKGNPFFDPGEKAYERTYFVHPRVGPNNATVFCNAKNFEKPCPICEYRNKKYGNIPDPDDKTKKIIGTLLPKERQIFVVRDREDKKKGPQFFDQSFHTFGKFLDNKINSAKTSSEKRKRQEFADPKVGSYIELTGAMKKGGGYSFTEFSDIQFHERKGPLPSELLDAVPDVDDWIKLEDYKKVKEMFFQTAPADEGEEEEEDEVLDDDTDDEEDDDGEDDDEESDEDDDEEDDEDDEEEESDDEDEEDDDDKEDEDEEEDEVESPPCKKGDTVRFEYKGKKRTGKVIRINLDDALIKVKAEGKDTPYSIDYDQVLKVMKTEKKGKKKKSREIDF